MTCHDKVHVIHEQITKCMYNEAMKECTNDFIANSNEARKAR